MPGLAVLLDRLAHDASYERVRYHACIHYPDTTYELVLACGAPVHIRLRLRTQSRILTVYATDDGVDALLSRGKSTVCASEYLTATTRALERLGGIVPWRVCVFAQPYRAVFLAQTTSTGVLVGSTVRDVLSRLPRLVQPRLEAFLAQ